MSKLYSWIEEEYHKKVSVIIFSDNVKKILSITINSLFIFKLYEKYRNKIYP